MRTSWECDHAEQVKSTLTGVGSAGGSEDRDCGEDVHCDRPKGEAGVQADVTRCSNAC